MFTKSLEGVENKRRLQTLCFVCYNIHQQHTSSEVNGYNCYKHLKNTKIKRGNGDKIKSNDKINTTDKLILPVEINK